MVVSFFMVSSCSGRTMSDWSVSLCKAIIIFCSVEDWLSEEPSCVDVAASCKCENMFVRWRWKEMAHREKQSCAKKKTEQVLTVLRIFVCVLICFVRWSDRMNFLVHSGHWKRFSPVCVLRCLWSSSDLVNFLPQNNQLQTNGRSPVCQRKWARRWLVFPYTLLHPAMWHMCCRFRLISLFLWEKKNMAFWMTRARMILFGR